MMKRTLRLATRKSPLALWQANWVKTQLEARFPSTCVELLPLQTEGDRLLDVQLDKIGGKGVFLKTLEEALLDHRADFAVHSMKDVPTQLPKGLMLSSMLTRGEVKDAFVSNTYDSFDALPMNACIGTSSLRRAAQLKYRRADLVIKPLRGNVGRRLRCLDEGEFDAIILAGAGLIRLTLHERIKALLDEPLCLPGVGQGAIGIECREDDDALHALLQELNDEMTARCVQAERAFSHALGGSCQVSLACLARAESGEIRLHGRVMNPAGTQCLEVYDQAMYGDELVLGARAAQTLIAQGAHAVLNQRQDNDQ